MGSIWDGSNIDRIRWNLEIISLRSLENSKNASYSGSYCSSGTVRGPARSTNTFQNDPIVVHFEAKILLVGCNMPG